MNARNLTYIRPYNKKGARRIADNKLISKQVLKKNEIPVPKLIAKITSHKDLASFDWSSLPTSFALKPASGFGGEGIVVVYGRKKGHHDTWVKADGSPITVSDLKNHIQNILDGSFSITNSPDIAFFEERLTLLKTFRPYSFKGIPDIRVIVYNSVPVMAMLRLPTKDSDGKANVQHGAIGAGIDMATGTTTTAVIGRSSVVEYVPGTRLLLSGIKIPFWKDILRLAIEAQKVSGIGFLGADVAIDRERGPVFLELNIRPGLSIQIANLSGLKERLERVHGLKIKSTQHGIRVGMNLFGGEIEEELEGISGKRVIGSVEKIKLKGKDDTEIEIEAKIDTGALSSSIDTELAIKLGYEDMLTTYNEQKNSYIPDKTPLSHEDAISIEKKIRTVLLDKIDDLEDISYVYSSSGASFRPAIKTSFIMDKQTVTTKINIIDRKNLKYPMIVGKRDLKKFLVDVSKPM